MSSFFHEPDYHALLRRVDTLSPDSQRRWGRMTVQGMVCHLNDAFLLMLGDRATRAKGNLFLRTVVRFVAFSTPIPWPKGAKTAPEADQEQTGTPPGDFDRDVSTLRSLMERFDKEGRGGLYHPIFGNLTPGEVGRWGYRHLDHHLRQFGV